MYEAYSYGQTPFYGLNDEVATMLFCYKTFALREHITGYN